MNAFDAHMNAGSLAKRAIALIAQRGTLRSDQLAEALGVGTEAVSGPLQWHVKNGTLVMCKVERPGMCPINEYRISAGGTASEFKQLKVKPTPRAAPPAPAAVELAPIRLRSRNAPNLRTNHADLRVSYADDSAKPPVDVQARAEAALEKVKAVIGAGEKAQRADAKLAAKYCDFGQPPAAPLLELHTHVPCPGLRFGQGEMLRNTLLAMKGDASFLVDDVSLVYQVAKKLGVLITTRKEGSRFRVWRIC